MAACDDLRWFYFIGVWMYLVVSVKCQVRQTWDGCVLSHSVRNVDICYKITAPIDGINAWKECTSIELPPGPNFDIFISSLRRTMWKEKVEDTTLWVGGIQAYPDSNYYVSYNGNFSTSAFMNDESGRRCLAIDTKESRFIGMNCAKKLPMVCAFRKYAAVLHNAEAPEACNFTNALVLEPQNYCCEIVKNCTQSIITVFPKNITANLKQVKKYHPVDVEIMKMRIDNELYLRPIEMFKKTTDICYKAIRINDSSDSLIRLELRYNKTMDGLTLWVKSPGRAVWPPKCVGGSVHNPPGDRRALFITPSKDKDASPVIWCYVKDFVTGGLAFSNSVMRPDKPLKACRPTETVGFPREIVIDEKSSCLRCLKESLSMCPENSEDSCELPCDSKTGCGHFGLTLEEWRDDLKRGDTFEGLEKCAMDEACAGEAIWQLTEGGDCNNDGVPDCDDRFARLFDTNCRGNISKDSRESQNAITYWNCRTYRHSDFADVLVENGTARYYCENKMPNERFWASPEYHDKISPYIPRPPTTTPPPPPTPPTPPTPTQSPPPLSSTMPTSVFSSPEPITQKQATRMLYKLKLKESVNITNEEMKLIIDDVSELLNVGEQALLKAQVDANVSSLAELLENILVHAPDGFNFTSDKISVIKERAIDFQLLITDNSTSKGQFDSFVSSRQIHLKDIMELNNYKNKILAAVHFPDLPENVTLLVVTFSKNIDFIPCKAPLKVENSNNASSSNLSLSSNSTDNANETTETTSMDTGNETVGSTNIEVSEKYCPFRLGIVIGCINTPILQVGLLDNNGTYVRLPDGKHVDLILRTRTNASLGQVKKCVYWDFEKEAWSSDGCHLVREDDGLDTCRCTHLTHFAQLVSDGGAVAGPHAATLRELSMYACTVSVFALCGVLSAGAFSRRWREKKENKVMLNLVVALCTFLLLFLWSAVFSKPPLNVHHCKDPEPPSLLCRARGGAMHYAVLSSFLWMMVEAHTHYKRLSSPSGIDVPHYLLKAALVGWGVPVVPVAVLFAVEADTYAGKGRDFCYPSGAAFYGAVLAPICAALLANAVIFARILHLLFPRCCGCRSGNPVPGRSTTNERRLLWRKVIVCIAFTFLFGLTWYVGLLSFTEEAGYFFCVVVMLQGPALFIFFVLGEENVKKRLKSIICRGASSRDQYSRGTDSTVTNGGPANTFRPDTMPLSQSYNSSSNTSPIYKEEPSSELCSFR